MTSEVRTSSKGTLLFAKIFGYSLLLLAILSAIFIHYGVGIFFLVFAAMLLIPSYGNVEYYVHKFLQIKVVGIIINILCIAWGLYTGHSKCSDRQGNYLGCMAVQALKVFSRTPY
ncbi:MAG: hypothetical protein PQ612_01760 [Rickettsiales bacterium]|nr:hypothetical protein [Pseudomonadota bacterium]MDA0965357.1 hypothetical protein [Pseudomonadota bacterium]MDG4544285.1 hypothetical protein [Rickettsiales bacterium]MDG4544870.1 hypothetical protein [Rickettsiales bacterium]MDG4546992.1 hypothetical protein [Rickettsiales bacterium]